MKVAGFLLIIVVTLFSCKEDKGNYLGGYYWIYTYGYPRMDFYEAADGISEKWKIKYKSVSGCMIDQKMINKGKFQKPKDLCSY